MNRSLFHGWRDVFSFTFKQGVSTKKYKGITLGIAIALFVAGMAISVIMAIVQQKDKEEISALEVVHVIDESNLQVLYLDGFKEANGEKYPNVSFVVEEGTVDATVQKITKEADPETGSKDAVLHISETEEGYLMNMYLPENSALSKDEGEDFLSAVTMVMEQSKLYSTDIPMEKLGVVMSGVITTMLDAGGDEKSMGEELVAFILPFIFVMFLYMMTILYGQSIGNVVSSEKVTKLMEMMLTMTRPYGLIWGKILATACSGILQMVIWIGSLVGGFFAGHFVAEEMIYQEYTNYLLMVFELLKSQDGSTAFSVSALVLGLLTACLAFLFYCVLAGMVASFADKAENLAQVMAYYQMAVIIGYFAGIFLPLSNLTGGGSGSETLMTLARIIPITSAYLLPSDILIGNITVLESLLYVGILLVTTIVLIIVTGKVYKNQLFYKGTGLKARFMKKKKVQE